MVPWRQPGLFMRMRRPWEAEQDVSAERARALIESQFPELAPARVTTFGAGWDNAVFLVNETWVFRFPRRTIAVPCMEAELRVLPGLAPLLPLAVPLPQHVGAPAGNYPWIFASYRTLPGRPASSVRPDDPVRCAAAPVLGGFLRALHSVDATHAGRLGAGPDMIGRLDVERLGALTRTRLAHLQASRAVEDASRWRVLQERPFRYRSPHARCVVHGDLGGRHLLLDDAGRPTGVIDWGDVHLGDPAVDLSVAHAFLPPAARDAFRAAYGPIDEATWELARFRALATAVALLAYSHDVHDGDLLEDARRSLTYIVSD